MMRRLIAAMSRLEDSWLGDLIGVLCLFAMLVLCQYAQLVFGGEQ